MTRSRAIQYLPAALAALVLLVSTQTALAQDTRVRAPEIAEDAPTPAQGTPATTEEIEARELFLQGRELMAAQAFERACEKFEQSLALTEGIGTKFNLADCYERLEQNAKAYELFLQVAEVTRQAGQHERHEVASARAKALKPKLASLRLEVKHASKELEVFLGPALVLREDLGVEFFVDAGEHELRARAPGRETWKKTVVLEQAEARTVRIPELEPLKEPQQDPEPEPAPASVPEDEGTDAEPESAGAAWVIPVTLGVGAAGLFAGLAGTQQYRTSHQDAQDVCPTNFGCTAEEIRRHDELVEDARRGRTIAAVGYAVAAGSLITGAIYYFTRPGRSRSESHARLTLTPTLASGAVGTMVHGRF